MPQFADVEPHGVLEAIFEDAWYLTGSVVFKPLIRLPRNMVVLRHGDELTLINSVRLDSEGLKALEALGTVTHVMKIGIHGMDDAFYIDRYAAQHWESCRQPGNDVPATTKVLNETTELPFPDAQVFEFKETIRPETAILVEREGGLMITCDSVQHWEPKPYASTLAKVVTKVMGFQKPAQIGPPWRKIQTKEGGSLRPDFERMAALPFERLIGGHGGLLDGAASSTLQDSIKREFGS